MGTTDDMTGDKEGLAVQPPEEPAHGPDLLGPVTANPSESEGAPESQTADILWSGEEDDRVEDTVQETAADLDADAFEEIETQQQDQSNPDESRLPSPRERSSASPIGPAHLPHEVGPSLRQGEPIAAGESSDAVNDSTQEKRQDSSRRATRDVLSDVQSASPPIAKTEK